MRLKHSFLLIIFMFISYGATVVSAQTRVDLSTQAKNIDFTNAPSVRPFRGGTALPATCVIGEMFFKMDAPTGSNVYGCVALNTWALQGQGSVPGAVGPQGAIGPQGPVGPKGDTGAGGAQGPQGLQGVQGIQGNIGPAGPAGTNGTGTVTHTLGALTVNLPVIGNGGADVTVGSTQGNTSRFVSYAGTAPAANDCARFDANGNLTTNGAACGSGGGATYSAGTGVVIAGTTISADTAALQDIASEQSNTHASVLATGGPTAYVASGSTTYRAYSTRMLLTVQFGSSCTGGVSTTIDLDGLGPKRLFKNDGVTNPDSTDCALNKIQEFVYNAAGAFQLLGGGGTGGTSVTAAPPYLVIGGISYIPALAAAVTLPPATGWTAAGFTGATFAATGLNGSLTITTAGTRTATLLQEQYRAMSGTTTLIAAVQGQGFLNASGQGECGVGATLASSGASYLMFQEYAANGTVSGWGSWSNLTTEVFRGYRIIGSRVSYLKMVISGGNVTTYASLDGTNWNQTDSRALPAAYDSWVFYAQPTSDLSPYGTVNCTLLSWSVS